MVESRKPYEKPTITEIDVGHLLEEAGTNAHAAIARFNHAKSSMETLVTDLGLVSQELDRAVVELDKARLALSKFDFVAKQMRG